MANAFEEVVPPFASTSASSSNPSKTRKRAPCDVFINHRGPDSKHTLVCIFSALCIFSAHASILLVTRLSLYSLVCIFSALCICSLSDLSFLAFLSLCPFFNRLTMANAFEEIVPPFASTSASSSNPSKKRKRAPYNVFINHRGPDSKHTLATSIHDTLTPRGLQVFLDEPELELGDPILSEIQDAMDTSLLHIVILSPKYAESPWCLAELSYILKTEKTDKTEKIIIPVFYNVEIADIRWGKGIYTDAFMKLEASGRYSSEKLQDWRSSLQQVTFRKGHVVKENG